MEARSFQLPELVVKGLSWQLLAWVGLLSGCSSEPTPNSGTSGGAPGAGGAVTSGGAAVASGGALSSGGAVSSGGASAGGAAAGGAASGGAAATGGGGGLVGTGGASAGGSTAGGSTAGGSTGAGGSTSASGGSAAGATGTAPIFSDNFEGTALNSKWIPKINGSGTFTLETAQKHGGAQALKVSTKNGYSTLLAFEDSSIFPAPDNTFYARVWFLVPTLPGNAHVIWLEAGDTTNDTHEVRIGMNLGFLQTNLWLNGEVDLRDPAQPLKANTWQCIEFKMGKDDLVVWLDDVELPAISTKNWTAYGANNQNGGGTARTNWSPTYKSFRLGWELNAGPEIWFDDVALSHSRIRCQ